MLFSMTGYGDASFHSDDLHLTIELRAVNNRYLKVTLRTTEPYHLLEPELEKVIRKRIRRGTVQVFLRCQRRQLADDFPINVTALQSYLEQVRRTCSGLGLSEQERAGLLGQVLTLPGVVPEVSPSIHLEEEWPIFEKVLEAAVDKLDQMRLEEGRAMALELTQLRLQILEELGRIQKRLPQMVEGFRTRLLERVRGLLQELDIKIDQSDLIKEVSIFAERADIAEEVVRLSSHLDQLQLCIDAPESTGRKLEFLTQEMFREANTIGSKASDVEISHHAVEIKAILEKIRELVQNVE